jgi:nicotinamidase-related amidase
MKPALLVVDIQNAWLEMSPELKRSVEMRAEEINEGIRIFREKGLPIIFIYHTDKGKGPEPGTRSFEFADGIHVRDSDVKVTKNYPNAFNKTNLVEILGKQKCDTVIIEGLSATGCILATYLGAMDHDLSPYLVKGAVASGREDLLRFVEEICDTLSLRAMDQML